MSEQVTYFCDICKRSFDPPPASDGQQRHGDCGVWFEWGHVGIPHVCPACQEKTTIAQARELLRARRGTRS